MISPISFTSTFKIKSNSNDFDKYAMFKHYAVKRSRKDATMELEERRSPWDFNSSILLNVDNGKDKSVEDFCLQNGIDYIKYSPDIK